MGAHSIGGAARSGYFGDFTGDKTKHHFDERYYSQMINGSREWKNTVRLYERYLVGYFWKLLN
jgi:hypothetical protein